MGPEELAANGDDIKALVTGITPSWGPLAEMGAIGRTIISVLLAGSMLFLLGRAILGAVHIKIGTDQNNSVQVKDGKKEVMSSLTAVFAIACLPAFFIVAYGLGINK